MHNEAMHTVTTETCITCNMQLSCRGLLQRDTFGIQDLLADAEESLLDIDFIVDAESSSKVAVDIYQKHH